MYDIKHLKTTLGAVYGPACEEYRWPGHPEHVCPDPPPWGKRPDATVAAQSVAPEGEPTLGASSSVTAEAAIS